MNPSAWLVLCLPFFLAAPVVAGEHEEGPPGEHHPGGEEPSPERMLKHLTEALQLDDKQKAKVAAAMEESASRSKAKRAEMKSLHEKMRAVAKEVQEEERRLQEKIREQLTLEQKDRFDAMRLRQRRGPGEGGGGGEEREERREFRRERFRRGGGEEGGEPGFPGGGEKGPGHFPPEMWHEHRQPGAPPTERNKRMDPRPDDMPPGAPPEPGGD